MQLGEYRKRRLDNAMEGAGADVIIASLPENVFYVTNGYRTMAMDSLLNAECFVVYSPGDNRLIYVSGYSDLPTILEYAGKAEVVCYGGFRFSKCEEAYEMASCFKKITQECRNSMSDALLEAVKKMAGCKRVAVDTQKMPVETYIELRNALGNSLVPDGADIFLEARRIKHPDEIQGVADAAVIAEKALYKSLAEFQIGMTEQDIQRLFEINLARLGADKLFCVVTAGQRAAYSDTINLDSPIHKGSMIRFDFGCRYKAYSSDLARTAFVGEPEEKVVKYYAALRKGVEAGIQAMVPKTKIKEVFAVTMDTVINEGIPHYQRHHVGHGIGLEAYDLPTISSTCNDLVENNTTYCLETPYYELGWGGLQIEHTIAVRDGQPQRLDRYSGDLIVL